MTAPFVPRTKTDRAKLAPAPDAPGPRSGLLDCGHAAKGYPKLSNPDRWWCCGGFQGMAGARDGVKKSESEPLERRGSASGRSENGAAPTSAGPSDSAKRRTGPAPRWTRLACIEAVQAFAREHGRTPSTADIKAGNVPTWDKARELFGGWPQLCDAAGLARPKVGRRSKAAEIGLAEGERNAVPPASARADVDRESRLSPAINARRVGEPDVAADLCVAFGKLARLLRLTALMYERHADVFKEVAADLEELAR